jgi:hypothetical protein
VEACQHVGHRHHLAEIRVDLLNDVIG